MAKYLSETGLQTVWSRIDSLFLRKASVDTVPTSGSTNLITSGGMYSVLEELEDTVAASENSLNTRLLAIEGMNLVTGTGLTADKLVLGNGNSTVKTSSKEITTTAPSSSSDDTTIPTSAAVNSAISSALGVVAGALKYKGTVASNSALPANHSVGDVYVVSTAGTFVGKACEVGDYIVCNTSGTAANNAHWDVLNGENQVSNASASLAAAGESATIATVDGTNITVTTPSTWTGLTKTGTITKVGNTASGDVAVSSSNSTAAFGNAVTVGTVGGVDLKFTMPANPNSDTKVTQTPTTSSNSSWRPLILGSSYSDAATFAPAAATDITYSTHLAKFKPSTGVLGVVGLNKMTTSGTVTTGSDTTVWNTNGGTVSLSGYATSGHTHTTTIAADSGTNQLTLAANTKYKLTAGGTSFIFTTPAHQSLSGYSTTSHTHTLSIAADSGTNALTLAANTKYKLTAGGSTFIFTTPAHQSLSGYVKLDAGAAEQTIKSSISSMSKGVVNLWRSSGDHYTFLGFSNGTTETALGGIGYKAQNDHNLYKKDGSNYYKIWDENNYTTWINTTNYPGLSKTGTVTSVTLTQGTGITVSDSGTAITGSGSRTISLASGVATAGTYRSVTVDTYGRVTSGTNPTTLSGYGITDAKIASGVITLGSNTITPLTSASTLDATKLSGTIPTSCYTDTNTDIRLADFFGESTDAASTAAKTTSTTSKSLTPGDLVTGLCAIIYHQYANSAASATLNVGGSGAKAAYNAAGTRISGSTGTWTAKDIIRWVYDASLNSGSGGWKISAILGNGDSHRLRLLTGRTPLYSETYQGTVTSVATGAGLTGGTITGTGTIKANLNNETSLGTIGTTSKLYAVGVDSAGKLCVNVPWEAGTSVTVSNKAATIGTSLTTIATVAGTDITAKIGSYASSSHSHAFSAITSKPTTVSGYGITDATTGIKFKTPGGGVYTPSTGVLTPVTMTAGRYLKDTSWTDITFSPSSGINTINAVPIYRQDACWGDWVFYWEGMNDQTHQSNDTKGGLMWKNGEFVMAGNFHCANSLAFYQSGSYVAGSINSGTIGASFYANNNGGGDSNSSAFFINVSSAAGGWDGHETFRFTKDGIYAWPQNNRTGITGWFINEADALTNSEIDTILANA